MFPSPSYCLAILRPPTSAPTAAAYNSCHILLGSSQGPGSSSCCFTLSRVAQPSRFCSEWLLPGVLQLVLLPRFLLELLVQLLPHLLAILVARGG